MRLQFGSLSYPGGVAGVCAPQGNNGGEKSGIGKEKSGSALRRSLYRVTNVPNIAANLNVSGPRRACRIKEKRNDLMKRTSESYNNVV